MRPVRVAMLPGERRLPYVPSEVEVRMTYLLDVTSFEFLLGTMAVIGLYYLVTDRPRP